MALLEIRLYPDPILRQRSAEVDEVDDALRRLVADMVETMHAAPGVGLAAPQVGVGRRLAVVDTSVGKDPAALRVLVNPRIVEERGSELDFEGCLSIPGVTEKVERPAWVRIAAQDLEGRRFELEAEGFEARAVCHEIDHLDGVLFIDRVRGLRRDRVRRQLKRLSRETVAVDA
ncbi:MAG TPA: peptide deformylase [Thermoanaerobaculia bacterium]|jgi:peptide deformylase